ncbi:Zinc-binding dehydrogenase [Bacillus sp. OV166]|nr:Zinc-binding dehydrogenase [Bacillus sp. OV166]
MASPKHCLWTKGKLQPLVDKGVFNFDQVKEAHILLESNKAIGKVVLTNEW